MNSDLFGFRRFASFAALLAILLVPAGARAQTELTGAITGVVRDASGGVLPGVTVEAASPALIEQTRSVVTDGEGVYRIVNLRPGTYSVTFTLEGFSRLIRDGIDLTASFTATVNADLAIGSLQETLTVTGAAPLVDTHGTESKGRFTRAAVDDLPMGLTTGVWNVLVPALKAPPTSDGGATGGVDVGGTQSERTQAQVTVHGGTIDTKVILDGVEVYAGVSSMNRLAAAEVNVQMGGNPAEAETGGVRINMVGKEGGNRFSGTLVVDGSTDGLQAQNVGDDLRRRGVTGSPSVKRVYNVGGALGGPILQAKAWFFGAARRWDTEQWLPGKFWNATQGTPFYTPGEPANTSDYYNSFSGRVTWRTTAKQKFSFTYEDQTNCNCVLRLIAQNRAPEATGDHTYRQHIPQVNWNYTVTNRLLFEAGASWFDGLRWNNPVRGVAPTDIAIRERSTGFLYNARGEGTSGPVGWYGTSAHRQNFIERATMTFVTGSHHLKTGIFLQQWPEWEEFYVNGGMSYDFLNGQPLNLILYASPDGRNTMAHNLGLFVQDQWTFKRLTFNPGLRFDRYSASARHNQIPAGPWLPARTYAQTGDLQNWKDLNPRVGIAYDVFGTGRTAVKAFLGRFVVGRFGEDPASDPANLVVKTANRTWTDTNRDYVPQPNELGPIDNVAFGNPQAATLSVDDAVSFGSGNRSYTWQGSVSVEHELRRGVGVSVAYFRTSYGNFTYNDNTLVAPADFDPYCIPAPLDARLPKGGGNQICGLYDVKPSMFGKVFTRQSLAGDLQSQLFNGVDVNVNARLARKGTLGGGLAMGETVRDTCGIAVDSPTALRFCRTTLGWADDILVKFNGSYTFPGSFVGSFVFQSLPGVPITASYVATSAEIAPSLGRNLASGSRGTATIDLIEPSTMFEQRTTNLDLRFAKRFTLTRGLSATVNVDVYNVTNASTPQQVNTQYGPAWLNVLNVMSGRLLRFGARIEF